ncbi:MAG: hypothetical protein ACKO39_07800, partial [Chthoniobacterales bacterium]
QAQWKYPGTVPRARPWVPLPRRGDLFFAYAELVQKDFKDLFVGVHDRLGEQIAYGAGKWVSRNALRTAALSFAGCQLKWHSLPSLP